MTISRAAARAIADLSDGVVLATVDIAAAPERVFHSLTDPKELVAWWGSPEAYHAEEWESDLRVGGRFITRGRSHDGKPYSVAGEFLVIDPPKRLVHTWSYDWGGGHSTKVAYELVPIDGGTRVTVRHSGFGDDRAACADHANGWQLVLGWLRARVETVQHFLCRLLPPRPDFGQTMTEYERSAIEAHVTYWTMYADLGIAIVFGPVADPNGGWGVAIVRVIDEAELTSLQQNDPAIRANIGVRWETLSMPRAVVSKRAERSV